MTNIRTNERVHCEERRRHFTVQFHKRKSQLSARNGDRHCIDSRYISRSEIELGKA